MQRLRALKTSNINYVARRAIPDIWQIFQVKNAVEKMFRVL